MGLVEIGFFAADALRFRAARQTGLSVVYERIGCWQQLAVRPAEDPCTPTGFPLLIQMPEALGYRALAVGRRTVCTPD